MKNLLRFGLGLASIVAGMATDAQTTPTVVKPIYGLVIHGGAGAPTNLTPEERQRYEAKLRESLDAGYAVLEKGGAAIDAVVAAIKVMEDAGMFDAGKGSVFNADGVCEMDAAVMDGHTRAAGAVTGLQHIKNPIELARAVMEKTPHVLLMGEGAEKFARQNGFEMLPNSYFQTERRREQWERARHEQTNSPAKPRASAAPSAGMGTVGCVALDQRGNLAAGTSTGGLVNKMPGRVGDSPLIGAGTYANNATCAVSGTGQGEYFIREVFAHNISALMQYKGLSLRQAADATLAEVHTLGGTGGCIAIDAQGRVAMPFNTAAMFRGCRLSTGQHDTAILPSEKD